MIDITIFKRTYKHFNLAIDYFVNLFIINTLNIKDNLLKSKGQFITLLFPKTLIKSIGITQKKLYLRSFTLKISYISKISCSKVVAQKSSVTQMDYLKIILGRYYTSIIHICIFDWKKFYSYPENLMTSQKIFLSGFKNIKNIFISFITDTAFHKSTLVCTQDSKYMLNNDKE